MDSPVWASLLPWDKQETWGGVSLCPGGGGGEERGGIKVTSPPVSFLSPLPGWKGLPVNFTSQLLTQRLQTLFLYTRPDIPRRPNYRDKTCLLPGIPSWWPKESCNHLPPPPPLLPGAFLEGQQGFRVLRRAGWSRECSGRASGAPRAQTMLSVSR